MGLEIESMEKVLLMLIGDRGDLAGSRILGAVAVETLKICSFCKEERL